VTPSEIVQGPVITEKGTLVQEGANQVVFRVHPRANKIEIRHAVEREGRRVESMRLHVVRAYSPTQHHVAFDVTAGPG